MKPVSDTVLNGKPFRQVICVKWLASADHPVNQMSQLVHDSADDSLHRQARCLQAFCKLVEDRVETAGHHAWHEECCA